jgi:hypothetical protein
MKVSARRSSFVLALILLTLSTSMCVAEDAWLTQYYYDSGDANAHDLKKNVTLNQLTKQRVVLMRGRDGRPVTTYHGLALFDPRKDHGAITIGRIYNKVTTVSPGTGSDMIQKMTSYNELTTTTATVPSLTSVNCSTLNATPSNTWTGSGTLHYVCSPVVCDNNHVWSTQSITFGTALTLPCADICVRVMPTSGEFWSPATRYCPEAKTTAMNP